MRRRGKAAADAAVVALGDTQQELQVLRAVRAADAISGAAPLELAEALGWPLQRVVQALGRLKVQAFAEVVPGTYQELEDGGNAWRWRAIAVVSPVPGVTVTAEALRPDAAASCWDCGVSVHAIGRAQLWGYSVESTSMRTRATVGANPERWVCRDCGCDPERARRERRKLGRH